MNISERNRDVPPKRAKTKICRVKKLQCISDSASIFLHKRRKTLTTRVAVLADFGSEENRDAGCEIGLSD